ncbi:hypothetical protein MMC17_005441 [Xylographa soralifera]|nr:hypothetical protein [Xylographa soralifera]
MVDCDNPVRALLPSSDPGIDENLLAPFPKGTKGISQIPYGNALWTVTSKVELELPDGERKLLFLKVINGDDPGKWIMEGEFETMNALYQNQPDFAPKPITWNNYKSDPQTWFFLCSFHKFGQRMVDPQRFTSSLASLHQTSISPNGRFGFHVHTSIAEEKWSDSWEECFVKMIQCLLDKELKQWGPDEELAVLSSHLLEVLIPRLLRPLTADDRQIKPCLVHGDLWYGNTGVDQANGQPLIFDGQALYAHNEYELGDWYQARNNFGKAYSNAYHSKIEIAVPVKEYNDRNILYSLKYDIQASVMFTKFVRDRNPSTTSSLSRFRFPLRSLSTLTGEDGSNSKGSTGLNLLYQPAKTLVELVFVHGLGGGSRKTWSFSSSFKHFWPQIWLPRDIGFRNVRIHSFGYESDWTSTKDDISNVSDFASSLLNALFYSSSLRTPMDTPIIFVAHSMGGLVVKKTYLLALQDETYKSISARVKTMIFLATPHRGADSAHTLNNILRISFAHSRKAYIDDLTRNSEALQTINDDFRHVADKLELFSFYETVKTSIGGTRNLIVDRGSAVLEYKHEGHMPIQANHRGICKYESEMDANYKMVRDVLAAMVYRLEGVGDTKGEILRDERKRLKSYLGMIETPEDDLESLQDCRLKAPGSCEWITSDIGFRVWCDDLCVDVPQYLWLTAKPGTGKSVLASYVASHIENDLKQDVGYFFFTQGHKFKSWLSVCLRSLAYQMALKSSDIRDVVLNLQSEDVAFDKEDARSIWRKLFVGGILRTRLQRPYYWVIDALDECNEPMVLLDLLAKPNLNTMPRVFFTSRVSGELSAGFKSLTASIISIDMNIERVSGDIKTYVSNQIGILSFEGEDTRQDVIAKIFDRSGGCFLWVKIVLEKLRRVHTSRAIQNVLEEVPDDMDELYQKILEQMSHNREEHEFIKAVLTWAACSTRPLTVDELREALKIDINDDVNDLQHSIAICCGHLVYVDSHKRVQLVHETARKFLLNISGSEFSISSSEGNRRLLQTCLKYLAGPDMDRRHRIYRSFSNTKAAKQPHFVLALYASSAFAEHLRNASASHESVFADLAKFLKSNVLTWVEFVASSLKSLHHLIRAAKCMKGYLERRAKYISPFSEDVDLIDEWAIDLTRLVTKFGKNILECPLAVYSQMPAFCPSGTRIYKQYALQQRGIQISGLSDSTWEDRISCISFRPEIALAIACGEIYFAVGVGNTIVLYYKTSCQENTKLNHGEDVHLLEFNATGESLVSSGKHLIRIFDVVTGDQLHCFHSSMEALAIAFTQEDQVLLAALKSNRVLSYKLGDKHGVDECPWEDAWETDHRRGLVLPQIVAFNQECSVLAICYRGRSISLWDLEEGYSKGQLLRNLATDISNLRGADGRMASFAASCEAIVFNACTNLLAAVYQDREICVFDIDTKEIEAQIDAEATALACSPDGQILACGELNGSIQLRNFSTLELLYKISTCDDAIVSLAFSADGLRLLDVRGPFCNVWEPAMLIRSDVAEDRSEVFSDGIIEPAKIVESRDSEEIVQITALASTLSGDHIFVGNEEGVVASHNMTNCQKKEILYKHAQFASVLFVEWHQVGGILISSDTSSRFIVSKLKANTSGCWSCERLFDRRMVEGKALRQILFAPSGEHFLTSGGPVTSIWSITGDCAGSSEMWEQPHQWSNHPRKSDELISICQKSTRILDWATLKKKGEKVNTMMDIGFDTVTTIKRVIVCPRAQHIIMAMENAVHPQRNTRLIVANFSTLDPNPETPMVLEELLGLETKVEYLVGSFDSKIIFLDRSLWVCSLDLMTFRKSRQYARHFFIPLDWMSASGDPVLEITGSRDLIFAKHNEIAVIKRGFARVAEVVWLDGQ